MLKIALAFLFSRRCLGYILLSSVAAFQDDHIEGKKHFYKAFEKISIEDITEDELASMPDGECSLIIFNALTLEISLDLVVAAAHYATRQDADTIFSKMARITGYRDVLRSSNAALLFGFYHFYVLLYL